MFSAMAILMGSDFKNNEKRPFSEDSKTCVPGKHYQDHLMFGCTGEGTEFTVVQQNCVNQAKSTSSGK